MKSFFVRSDAMIPLRKLALLILLLLVLPVTVFPSKKPEEKLQFRIGFIASSDSIAEIYSPPIKGMIYHVLSYEGAVVFRGNGVAGMGDAPCGGAQEEGHWFVVPHDKKSYRHSTGPTIIIETPVPIELKPIAVEYVEKQTTRFIEYSKKLANKFQLKNYEYEYYIVGSRKGQSRGILLMVGDPNPQINDGDRTALISVANIDNKGMHEQHTDIFKSVHGDLFAILDGVADTDGDGFADVFLIGHGDFNGHKLLIQADNQWEVQEGDGPGPC